MKMTALWTFTLTFLGVVSLSRPKVIFVMPTNRHQVPQLEILALPAACRHQVDPGHCRATIPRYYFNPYTGKCDTFNYGGCGGNKNNFKTADDCFRSCACAQPAKQGSCRGGYIPRYHFSHFKGTCELFIWSGCDKNDNNFETKGECLSKCSVCSLSPDHGPCNGKFLRYFFDPSVGCRPFVYGGCGGNANNFLNGRQCVRHCFPKSVVSKTVSEQARVASIPHQTSSTQPAKSSVSPTTTKRKIIFSRTGKDARFVPSGTEGESNSGNTGTNITTTTFLRTETRKASSGINRDISLSGNTARRKSSSVYPRRGKDAEPTVSRIDGTSQVQLDAGVSISDIKTKERVIGFRSNTRKISAEPRTHKPIPHVVEPSKGITQQAMTTKDIQNSRITPDVEQISTRIALDVKTKVPLTIARNNAPISILDSNNVHITNKHEPIKKEIRVTRITSAAAPVVYHSPAVQTVTGLSPAINSPSLTNSDLRSRGHSSSYTTRASELSPKNIGPSQEVSGTSATRTGLSHVTSSLTSTVGSPSHVNPEISLTQPGTSHVDAGISNTEIVPTRISGLISDISPTVESRSRGRYRILRTETGVSHEAPGISRTINTPSHASPSISPTGPHHVVSRVSPKQTATSPSAPDASPTVTNPHHVILDSQRHVVSDLSPIVTSPRHVTLNSQRHVTLDSQRHVVSESSPIATNLPHVGPDLSRSKSVMSSNTPDISSLLTLKSGVGQRITHIQVTQEQLKTLIELNKLFLPLTVETQNLYNPVSTASSIAGAKTVSSSSPNGNRVNKETIQGVGKGTLSPAISVPRISQMTSQINSKITSSPDVSMSNKRTLSSNPEFNGIKKISSQINSKITSSPDVNMSSKRTLSSNPEFNSIKQISRQTDGKATLSSSRDVQHVNQNPQQQTASLVSSADAVKSNTQSQSIPVTRALPGRSSEPPQAVRTDRSRTNPKQPTPIHDASKTASSVRTGKSKTNPNQSTPIHNAAKTASSVRTGRSNANPKQPTPIHNASKTASSVRTGRSKTNPKQPTPIHNTSKTKAMQTELLRQQSNLMQSPMNASPNRFYLAMLAAGADLLDLPDPVTPSNANKQTGRVLEVQNSLPGSPTFLSQTPTKNGHGLEGPAEGLEASTSLSSQTFLSQTSTTNGHRSEGPAEALEALTSLSQSSPKTSQHSERLSEFPGSPRFLSNSFTKTHSQNADYYTSIKTPAQNADHHVSTKPPTANTDPYSSTKTPSQNTDHGMPWADAEFLEMLSYIESISSTHNSTTARQSHQSSNTPKTSGQKNSSPPVNPNRSQTRQLKPSTTPDFIAGSLAQNLHYPLTWGDFELLLN